MRNSSLWVLAAVSVLSLPLSAQEPPSGGIPLVSETIDVRVVNVEAVITDKSGKPVRGLSAGDFRLLVDGQEVPVEYFTEVEEGTSVAGKSAAGPAAAPAAPVAAGEAIARSYLVFVDDSFSLAGRRNDLLEKIERDLSLLTPADRMAVLAFDGSRIDVLCGWTSEAGKLREALARARQRPAQGGQMLAHQRALDADVEWIWDNVSSIDTGDSSGDGPKARELDEIFGAMGKRISPEARTQLGKTAYAAAASLRGFEVPPGRRVLLLLSGAWSLSVVPRLYGPFLEAANRLGYTVYPVDASQSDAAEVTVLDRLARATGGRALTAAANDALREAVADSGSYYWLGFTPAWKADDRQHAVTVEVRRPGLAVRSRGGFSDMARRTEVAMKAESVLLFGGMPEDRRLIVQLGEAKRKGRTLEVPVTLGVPVEALSLEPQGEGYRADVPIAVASQDEDGGRADLPRLRLQVAMQALPKAGTYARFQTVLQLRNAKQQLVFTVHDPLSGHALWGEADLVPERGDR
jgi:VWFA-related protein